MTKKLHEVLSSINHRHPAFYFVLCFEAYRITVSKKHTHSNNIIATITDIHSPQRPYDGFTVADNLSDELLAYLEKYAKFKGAYNEYTCIFDNSLIEMGFLSLIERGFDAEGASG